jgi:hypothetical protein
MTVPTVRTINFLCLGLIVPSLIYSLVTQLWSLPLKDGHNYFLGVEVAPGFYEGPESRWLARYRGMLATVFAVDFGALAAVLAMGQWDWVPIWAGSTAVFLTGSMTAFSFWARHRVSTRRPVLRAALSLEPRRLGDYIWWPLEVLSVAVVACSWWMLLRRGGPIALQNPLSMSWAVLGLLPGKILVVRQGWPVPAERAEEHHKAQEAARRYSVRLMDAFGWLLASILFMMALRDAWPAARSVAGLQWLTVGVPLAFGAVLMVAVGRQKRVIEMGRTLRPAGSWTPPHGRAALMSRAGMVWFTIWFGGIMAMTFLVRG